MLARWLMAFCVVPGFLFLSEDARGYEVLPQIGTTFSTKASPHSGFAGLTLSKQSMPKMGDSFRLFDERKALRFGVLEEAGWGAQGEEASQAAQTAAGPKQQDISLLLRLLKGAGTYLTATLSFSAILFPLADLALDAVLYSGSVAIPILSLGTLATVMALVVSWAVWTSGNGQGGEGSYLATMVGMALSMAIQAGVVLLEVFHASDRSEMLSAISLPMLVVSLFGPVAGYEISSHRRRQRRNYSVGLSPVLATGPAASMRVDGAALAIRGGF